MNYLLLELPKLEEAIFNHLCKDDIATEQELIDNKKLKTSVLYFCLIAMALGIIGSIILILTRHDPNFKNFLPAGIGVLLGIIGIIVFVRAKTALSNFQPKRVIKSIKVGVLPLGSYPGSKGSYVFDGSGLTETVKVRIPQANAPDKIKQVQKAHEYLTATMPDILPADMPTRVNLAQHQVDQTLFAEEAKLHTIYEKTFELFDSMETEVVPTPLMHLSFDQIEKLLWVAYSSTPETGWPRMPKVSVLQDEVLPQVAEIVSQLEGEVDPEGEASQEREKVSTLFRNFLEQIKKDQQVLAIRRKNSLAGVMPCYAKDLERLSVMTSYNCYCPECNREVIEVSAREGWDSSNGEFPGFDFATRMNPVKGGLLWECPLCGLQTEEPFPVHKLLDELVYPTMDKLLQENRVERLKIYHDAQEKKRQVIDTIQKDIGLLAESTQKEAREFQARIREIASGVDGAKDTIELLAKELSTLDALRNSRIANLSAEMNTHIRKIAEYKESTLREYHQSVDAITEEASRDLDKLAAVARQEEQARMAIQHQIARNLTRQTELTEKQVSLSEENLAAAKKGNELLTEGNALNRTMVRKMGGYKSKPPNIMGMAEETLGDIGQGLTGASDYDRARGEGPK